MFLDHFRPNITVPTDWESKDYLKKKKKKKINRAKQILIHSSLTCSSWGRGYFRAAAIELSSAFSTRDPVSTRDGKR